MSDFNLTHHFLIAMPAMQEGVFAGTLDLHLRTQRKRRIGDRGEPPDQPDAGRDVRPRLTSRLISPNLRRCRYTSAGRCRPNAASFLHDTPGNWESTLHINDKLSLTTSKDILEAMGEGRGPRNVIVTLGYAGWDQGQLEHEMTENTWLTVPASEHILFELPPDERLPAAMALLGVDYASLVDDAGHA